MLKKASALFEAAPIRALTLTKANADELRAVAELTTLDRLELLSVPTSMRSRRSSRRHTSVS